MADKTERELAQANIALNGLADRVEVVEGDVALRFSGLGLAHFDAGKSCIRYRKGEQIDFGLLDRILADTARQDRGC